MCGVLSDPVTDLVADPVTQHCHWGAARREAELRGGKWVESGSVAAGYSAASRNAAP